MGRRALSVLVAVVLVAGMMPLPARAADDVEGDASLQAAFSGLFELLQTTSGNPQKPAALSGDVSAEVERVGIGGGGALFDPAVSPFDANDMAVGTDMGDLYVTRDGGGSWAKKTVGRVYDIQYDPTRQGIVYATGSGIWRSTDYGETFELMWPKADHVTGEPTKYEQTRFYLFNSDGYDPYSQVVSIVVDRANNSNIYALATKSATFILYRSTDGGDTFAEIARQACDMRGINSRYDNSKLVVNDGVCWLCTQAGIFAYSGTATLSPIYQPDGATYFSVVDVVQVLDDGTHGAPAGAYYWIAEGLESGKERPVTSLRRFTVGPGGELPFTDFTASMNDQSQGLNRMIRDDAANLTDIHILGLAATAATRLYFYTQVTSDSSNTILARYDALLDTPFKWVFGYQLNHSTSALSDAPGRFDLQNLSHADSYSVMYGIAASPAAPNRFLLSTGFGLYGSPDCEQAFDSKGNWYPRRSNVYQLYSSLHASSSVPGYGGSDKCTYSTTGIDNVTTYGARIDPFDKDHVAMLNTDIGLTLSNDAGATWSRSRAMNNNQSGDVQRKIPDAWSNTAYDLAFDRYVQGRVYSLWSGRHDAPYETKPASDKTASGGFAVANVDEAGWSSLTVDWSKADGGKLSSKVGETALPSNSIPVRLGVAYPADDAKRAAGTDRTFWVACFGGGFYRSTDSGTTFQAVNGGIAETTDDMIYAADVEVAEDGSRVFGMTARRTDHGSAIGGKVYRWDADAQAWAEIPLPEGVACPRDISWDERTQTLYISCVAANSYTGNGGDASQPDFKNSGGGLFVWRPGDAVASALDAVSAVVGDACSIEGAAIDSAGNLFVSDARGNVYLQCAGADAFEKIYDRFHVSTKNVQLVDELVSSDGAQRADMLALPSLGGGQLLFTARFTSKASPDSGEAADPAQIAAVKEAAEAALAYCDEQEFAALALKDAFEMKLPGALCYAVGDGEYHALYGGGYFSFTVSDGKVASAGAVDAGERLRVYDTLADAEAAVIIEAPSAFITRGRSGAGDRGHGYYERVDSLAAGDVGFTARRLSYALRSAESAVNPYQLGYVADPDDSANSVNDAIEAFHASAFHTLVFPAGDYRLTEDVYSRYDDRAYYGLDAALFTDGAVALQSRNAGHGSLWVVRGDIGWSKGESYVDGKGEAKKKDIYYHVAGIELNGLAFERRTGTSGYNRMVSVRSARDVTFSHCTFDGITKDSIKPTSGDTESTNGAIVDFYGDYDNVRFLDSTIVGEAAIDIRDLCDHVGNIPASMQVADDYPTGGRNVVVRGNDITTHNFDEGLPIFAGNQQGIGSWKDGVFTEYPTLTHCLVENVLVEHNAYTMLEPQTNKQRVVSITCGYQDSPVRNAVIRNNTFDVFANSYLILFGYAEDCQFVDNKVTLRRTTTEGQVHELVTRSSLSRTGPASNVKVSGNEIKVLGEQATVERMVSASLGPEALSFTGNDVTVEGTVSRVFDSTAVQEYNTFHLNKVTHLYGRVGEVAHNAYDIKELGNLYESHGTDAKVDLSIHDEKASIAELTNKYLLTFNGTALYNGHSLTFANCVYDAAALPEGVRVAYNTAYSETSRIVDDLKLAFIGCEISGCTSAKNYVIVWDSGSKVALSVAEPIYSNVSVAALRANRALAAGDVVRTRAYYEGGVVNEASAGSGVYDIEVHADWQSSEDDGGSHVRLENGLWAVLRVADRTVDVRQFGAKGDGATDGTAETANANATAATDDANRLAAVMGYAAANPGTTVYFPEGAYCVSRGIEVPPQTTLTGAYATTDVEPAFAVVAEGKSATLGMYAGGVMRAKPNGQDANIELLATITPLDPTTHSTSLVSLGDSSDVAIDHLAIDAGRSMQAVVDALPNYSINNYDWTDPAMPYRGYFTALTFGGNKNVKVADCIVRNNVSMGCQFNGGENVSFERCDFLSVDVGIQEQGASPVRNVFIRDCYFEGHDWSEPVAFGPSYAGDATGIWIERNTMRGVRYGHAIAISEPAQAYVDHTTFKDIHINGNTAYDMASLIGVSVADGLEMRNNKGYDSGQSYLYSCKNVTIDGLEMHGSVRHGLLVGQECEDVNITGLVVENYDQDGGGAPGIDLSGIAKNVSLAGRVESTLEHSGPGVNLSGSGYDISGLQFNLEPANYFDVMVYEGGAGNALHVGSAIATELGIAEDAYRVPRIYVAEAAARSNDFTFDYAWPMRDRGTTTKPEAREQFSGMRAIDGGTFETLTTLPTGHGRYYKTVAIQAWDGVEDGTDNLTASYMEPAQDGFTRTISLFTASDMHLANGDPSRAGAIMWEGERALAASGEPYELVLVCRGGVWYEQGNDESPEEFSSLAALRAGAGLTAGQVVTTLAYREGSGKGGASYLVCDAATAADLAGCEVAGLADDGGRLIGLAGTPGMWAVLAGVEADAYAFGAYGDGEHDDAGVLQALLDSGLENVHLSSGAYLVGAPLVAAAPLSLEGAGARASKLVASDALSSSGEAALFAVRGVEGFSVSGIGLVGWEGDAGAATGALDLLRIDGCARTSVSGCAFGPSTGDGISIAGSVRTEVSDCAISGVATGIHVRGAVSGADDVVTLMRNAIANVAVDGIAFAADGSIYQGKVALYGNTVTGAPAGAGILLARVNRYDLVEIGTNVISECYVGIRAGGVTGTLDATDNNPRRITSNTVRNATYGIIFERSSGTALILNEVYDVQRTGFYLDTLSDCCTIWCWVTRYGLDTAGSVDGLSDGCAIECVGAASNVTLGGWVRGNHRLADYAATMGRTACRVDGGGWDLSGLTFFCTMQEEDGRPTVTFAAGAEGNAFRTQFDAIVLDASGDGKNVIEAASGSDVRLIVWSDRAEAQRVQGVINPTDPRAGLVSDEHAYTSVAAMRADGSLAVGDVVTTAAYYEGGTAGDVSAGAGVYDIRAVADVEFANASKAVDGGRYIELDSGLVAVLRVEDETVDLYQYGASGDSATDDRAAVQAALRSGAATVHVSAGTYLIGGGEAGGISLPSDCALVGDDRETCTFIADEGYPKKALFAAYGSQNITLRGVGFSGNIEKNPIGETYNDQGGISLLDLWGTQGTENVVIEDCRFKDNAYAAVRIMGGEGYTVRNCAFSNTDCCVITLGEVGVKRLAVTDNTMDGHRYSEAITLFTTAGEYDDVLIARNTIRNKTDAVGIFLRGVERNSTNEYRNVRIEGNTVDNCAVGLGLSNLSASCKVLDNTVVNNATWRAAALLDGADALVDGLTVTNAQGYGLWLENCANVTVRGLDVEGFTLGNGTYAAVRLDGAGAGTTLAGRVAWTSASTSVVGVDVRGSGYDLSGLTFANADGKRALALAATASGNRFHTDADVAVTGTGDLTNDIVIDSPFEFSGGAAAMQSSTWQSRFRTSYVMNWTTTQSESLSSMPACQDGFTRTLTVKAVNSDVTLANGNDSPGSIIWLDGGHIIAKGESATFTLVCQGSRWHEVGRASIDIADVDDVLLNPGKGWVAYGPHAGRMTDWEHYAEDGAAAGDYSGKTGIGYWRWDWAEIEPEHGVYNWQPIDDAIADFWSQGKQFAFGIMAANTVSEREYVTPKWVFDAGAQGESFANKGADGATTQVFPIWTDEVFLRYTDEFVAALGERYNGDERVAFVDIRSYGNYGEQHLYGINDTPEDGWQWMLSRNVTSDFLRERYIKPYMAAFPDTLLVNVWGLEQYDDTYEWAIGQGVSIRRDGIMYHSDGHECAMAAGKLPAVYEYSWYYWYWKNRLYTDKWQTEADWQAWFQAELAREVEAGQPSYMQLDFNMYRENRQWCDWMANRMGYWLRLKHAEYDSGITAGKATEVSLTFANDGVAPIFRPAVSCLALLDGEGKAVARQKVDWDAASWKPGEQKVESASVAFESVPDGSYRLAFGLFASESDEAPTYLLGSAGATGDKWYVLGSVAVSDAADPEPPAHVHALERVAAVPATCLVPGVREHWRCVGCGKLFADADGAHEVDAASLTAPATGHAWDEWQLVVPPTCTEPGREERVCKNDPSHRESREVAAHGHTWGEWQLVVPPTCTGMGREERICSACGDVETREVAARGHDWGEWRLAVAPTCTEPGRERSVCASCGEVRVRMVRALGHVWGEPTYEWAADFSSVVARVACAHDSSHVVEERAETSSEILRQPTESAAGIVRYVAEFAGESFETQRRVAVLPAAPGVSVPAVARRLYNPNSGEHFFTFDVAERDALAGLGWQDEGEAWGQPASGTPVWRLYNPNAGEHHYTLSEAERDWLASLGWSDEGVGWLSSGEDGVAVWRLYNPNEFAHNHHFTADAAERDWLISLGWQDEGVAWYGRGAVSPEG